MSHDLIRHLEDLAARAWPPAYVQILEGWQIRHTAGMSYRSNSVLPRYSSATGFVLAEQVRLVEEYYASRELAPTFRISPAAHPAELDTMLAERGYERVADGSVLIAPLDSMLARVRSAPGIVAEVGEQPGCDWLTTYCIAEGIGPHERESLHSVLRRVPGRLAFAVTSVSEDLAATALGVLEGEWLGLFCVATRPEFRRRGAASAAVAAVSGWGKTLGARNLYLQVEEVNVGARLLYEQAGMQTLYRYHFRRKPLLARPSTG
jgi:N-acetylglutamate synthase